MFGFKTFRNFKKDKNKRIVLLLTPEHGNMGDTAICMAELEYLKKFCPDFSVHEFMQNETLLFAKKIMKNLRQNDVVMVHGGGNIGSIWKASHNVTMWLLEIFKNNKLIIFPQTIFFDGKDKKLISDFIERVNSCKNLTIFLREKNSFEAMQKLGLTCKLFCVPDMVLSLSPNFNVPRKAKVLVVFRKDREKTISKKKILNLLKANNVKFDKTDTVIPAVINKHNRQKCLNQKFKQFASYQLVITDRLHGMVFSLINNTPCICFDNTSKKVSGVHEWIKDEKSILNIPSDNLDMQTFQKMFSMKPEKFDNSKIIQQMEKIYQAVNNSEE